MKAAAKPASPRSPRRSAAQKRARAATPAAFSSAASAFIAAAVADGLAIQHRFKAKPVYARTGSGYLAPAGVAEIAAAKQQARARAGKR